MAQGIITENENGIYYLATLVQPWGTIEKIYYDYLLNGKFWTNYLLKGQIYRNFISASIKFKTSGDVYRWKNMKDKDKAILFETDRENLLTKENEYFKAYLKRYATTSKEIESLSLLQSPANLAYSNFGITLYYKEQSGMGSSVDTSPNNYSLKSEVTFSSPSSSQDVAFIKLIETQFKGKNKSTNQQIEDFYEFIKDKSGINAPTSGNIQIENSRRIAKENFESFEKRTKERLTNIGYFGGKSNQGTNSSTNEMPNVFVSNASKTLYVNSNCISGNEAINNIYNSFNTDYNGNLNSYLKKQNITELTKTIFTTAFKNILNKEDVGVLCNKESKKTLYWEKAAGAYTLAHLSDLDLASVCIKGETFPTDSNGKYNESSAERLKDLFTVRVSIYTDKKAGGADAQNFDNAMNYINQNRFSMKISVPNYLKGQWNEINFGQEGSIEIQKVGDFFGMLLTVSNSNPQKIDADVLTTLAKSYSSLSMLI